MSKNSWGLLRGRVFRIVIGGEFVSLLGDGIYTVALAWLVLSVSSAKVLAVTLICLGVPRGLLLLIGGAATDRLSSRQVMFVSHVTRAILVTALGLAVAAKNVHPWEFYVISAAFGVADAFFWPASKAILPTLVPSEDLPQANAINSVAEQAPALVGPLLGGALVAGFGAAVGLFCDAGTFLLAAITILAAPRSAVNAEKPSISVKATFDEIRAGFSYARRKPGVRWVLLIISASALAYGGLFGVGLPRLAQTFPERAFGLGVMYSSWGFGQLGGALSAAHTGLPRRWGMLIIGMAFAEGTTFALLGVVPNLFVVSVMLALLGFGVAYSSDVALPTWVQVTTSQEMLGRVSSIMDIPRVALEPLSMVMMGILCTISVRLAFFAASIPMLAAACILLATKSARTLQTATTPDASSDEGAVTRPGSVAIEPGSVDKQPGGAGLGP